MTKHRLFYLRTFLCALAGFLPALNAEPAQNANSVTEPTANKQQEPSLEDLLKVRLSMLPKNIEVSTASRVAQSAQQAPASIYVVTSYDIRLYQMRTLADILRSMPGLHINDDGSFSYVGIRGMGRPGDFNSRLLFLIDGIRANENISDAGSIGNDGLIDVEAIDRVEFAPGPGSALYGNNAFFGVVNIITKKADKLRGLALAVALDDQGQQQVRASAAHRSDDWEAWLSGSLNARHHIELGTQAPPELIAPLENLNTEDFYRIQGGGRSGAFTLHGAVNQRNRYYPHIEQQDWLRFEQIKDQNRNHLLRLSHQHEFNPQWQLQSSVSHSSMTYRRLVPYLDETFEPHMFVSESDGAWQQFDLRLSNQSFAGHLLLAGAEYQKDSSQQINLYVVGAEPLQSFFGDNERTGFYLQDLWQLNSSHSLILGLRHDKSRVSPNTTTPRLAWIWQLSDDHTLKLMHGTAFRSTNLSEFSLNAPWQADIPTPEKIATSELAWQHFLSASLNYRIAIFHSDIKDLIELDQNSFLYINGAGIHSSGLEASMEKRWPQGQQLKLNLAWQQSRDHYQQQLVNSPRQLLSLHYQQPWLSPDLMFGWQMLAQSQRQGATAPLAGYVLHNITWLWQPNAVVELSFGIHNLTDVQYFDQLLPDVEKTRQAGRSVRLQLQWRFSQ